MAYRLPAASDASGPRWRPAHRDLLSECGIPDEVADSDRRWGYLLLHGVDRPESTKVKLSVDDTATGEADAGTDAPAALRDNATAPSRSGDALHMAPMLNVVAPTRDGAIVRAPVIGASRPRMTACSMQPQAIWVPHLLRWLGQGGLVHDQARDYR